MRRLVVYVGLDGRSISLIRKVRSYYRSLFDEVTIVQVPEVGGPALKGVSIPSLVVEEYGKRGRVRVEGLDRLALSESVEPTVSEAR